MIKYNIKINNINNVNMEEVRNTFLSFIVNLHNIEYVIVITPHVIKS
jgi:hypothetical protein